MNPKTLVHALKDSTAQVLLAFFFAGHAMDTKEIQAWTGLKRETIYKAVDSLVGMELLATQTLAHGRKLWLPGAEMLPYISQSQMSTLGTSDLVVIDDSNREALLPSITTITTTISQESTKRTPEELASLKVALNEYNIIGKKRQQLIASEWVSADYVRAHCKAAQSENWDQPVGMAITRMLEQVPAPEMMDNGHPTTCQCAKCKVDKFMNPSKYITGKYSEFIR